MAIKDRSKAGPKRQEKRVASEMGGKRIPFSGSLAHEKADVVTERYLIEAKQTSKKSYAITESTLLKIVLQATRKKRCPLLQIDVQGMTPGNQRWVLMPMNEFLTLTGQES